MMAERIVKRRKRSSTLRSGALPGREMLVVGVEVIMRDEGAAARACRRSGRQRMSLQVEAD